MRTRVDARGGDEPDHGPVHPPVPAAHLAGGDGHQRRYHGRDRRRTRGRWQGRRRRTTSSSRTAGRPRWARSFTTLARTQAPAPAIMRSTATRRRRAARATTAAAGTAPIHPAWVTIRTGGVEPAGEVVEQPEDIALEPAQRAPGRKHREPRQHREPGDHPEDVAGVAVERRPATVGVARPSGQCQIDGWGVVGHGGASGHDPSVAQRRDGRIWVFCRAGCGIAAAAGATRPAHHGIPADYGVVLRMATERLSPAASSARSSHSPSGPHRGTAVPSLRSRREGVPAPTRRGARRTSPANRRDG